MTIPAQQIGQIGRRFGNAQLRGHFGRIPFLAAAAAGKATLFEGGATAALLELGATATLTATGATATLTSTGATATLLELGATATLFEEIC